MNRLFCTGFSILVTLLTLGMSLAAADSSADFAQGIALRITGKSREAVRVFERVLEKYPRHCGALVHMGAALEDLGRSRAAQRAYRRALDIEPHNESARRNLSHLRAASAIRAPLDEPPASWIFLLQRGKCDVNKGNFREALRSFRIAEGLLPDDPRPLFYAALCLERMGRRTEVKKTYRTIIERFPAYAPAHVNLALIFLEEKNREQAGRTVLTALSSIPDNARLRYLGRVLNVPAAGSSERASYSAFAPKGNR